MVTKTHDIPNFVFVFWCYSSASFWFDGIFLIGNLSWLLCGVACVLCRPFRSSKRMPRALFNSGLLFHFWFVVLWNDLFGIHWSSLCAAKLWRFFFVFLFFVRWKEGGAWMHFVICFFLFWGLVCPSLFVFNAKLIFLHWRVEGFWQIENFWISFGNGIDKCVCR